MRTTKSNSTPTSIFRDNITEHLSNWIVMLGLKEWDITWHIATNEGECENALAEVQVESSIKWAHICINKESEFKKNTDRSLEQVIIHELLHVKFALIQPDDLDTTEYRVQHQLIDELASILYKTKNHLV